MFGARQLVNSLKVCGEVQKATDPAQARERRQRRTGVPGYCGKSILGKYVCVCFPMTLGGAYPKIIFEHVHV